MKTKPVWMALLAVLLYGAVVYSQQPVNVSQMNAVAVTMGNGASGTGVQRVTIANDSTGIIALTTGSAQIGHLEANQSVNVAQMNGVTTAMNNGTASTGTLRVAIASDNSAVSGLGAAATGAAVPANAVQIGGNGSGNLTAPLNCDGYAKYDAATNGATELVALSSSKVIYICGYSFSSSSTTANTLKLVYGTGSNCATGQTAMTPGVVLQAATSTGPVGKVIPVSGWARGLKSAASNAVCLLTNAAQTAQAEIWYTQF